MKEGNLSRVAELIEIVASANGYIVEGVSEGDIIIYSKMEDDSKSLWASHNGDKLLLARGDIGLVAASRRSPWVLYSLDVSGGREESRLEAVDSRSGESVVLEGFKHARITGIAWDGYKAVVSVSTDRNFELRLVDPSSWTSEAVYEIDRPIFVSDVDDGIAVGTGYLEGDPRSTELFIYYIDKAELAIYTPIKGSTNKRPKIRGGKVLFSNSLVNDQVLVLDIASLFSRPPQMRYGDFETDSIAEIADLGWINDEKIWIIAKNNGRAMLYIDGKRIKIPHGSLINGYEYSRGLIVTYSSFNTPPSIGVVKNGRNGNYEFKIKVKGDVKKQLPILEDPELIWVESVDDIRVPTWVIKSKASEIPGPTVIYLHGGPWSEVADEWRPILASFIYAGFNIVAPNYRGSTGYGEHYRRLIIGDPGGSEVDDVLSVAKWAKNSGLADELYLAGYSYGGYLALMAASREPELFEGVVAGASITDWEEAYELSDALFKRFIEVLFNGNRQLLKIRSPISYAENVKASICLIHPSNDSRTPLTPVLKYALKLHSLGKGFEIHVIPGIGHLINDKGKLRKILLPTLLFLEELKSQADVREMMVIEA